MSLNKKTMLQRAASVDIELRPDHLIRVTIGARSMWGMWNTLAILHTFERAKTLADGLAALEPMIQGMQAWIEVTTHISDLYKFGALEAVGAQKVAWQHVPGRYDSAGVHIRMLNDYERTVSYQRAIREMVTAADIVVDIGTGTGVLATTAALAGAKHVYAIERTSVADMAQAVFEANGVADRVTLIRDKSTRITLPQKGTLLVSELLGNDPLQELVLETTRDAVQRLLQPQARLLPARLKLYGLPLSMPPHKVQTAVFTPDIIRQWQAWYDIDFAPLLTVAAAQDHALHINTYETKDWIYLTAPVLLSEFELKALSYDQVKATVPAEVTTSGLLNGILIYFELELSPQVSFSIHPHQVKSHNHWHSKVWIPGQAIPVQAGESITLEYKYHLSGSTFVVHK